MFARFKRLIVNAWLLTSILSLVTFATALAGGSIWWVGTDFGGEDGAYGMVLQSNGKIMLVGDTFRSTSFDFALARYTSNGALDTTFSGDGKQITNFGGNDSAYDIAVQSDGKIIVVGDTCNGSLCNVALARYLPGGKLDTTFSGDGKVVTDVGGRNNGARGVVLQPDGKIVVIGYAWNKTDPDFVFYRYNANGSRDTTFSGDGVAIGGFGIGRSDFGSDVVIQGDGKILGVGYSADSTGSNFAIARLNANGTADKTFSGDGRATTNFGGNDAASAVALQADGKIVVAGYKSQVDFFSFAVARYNANGSLDTTLNGTGKKAFSIEPGVHSYGYDVIVQSNGKIVMVGNSWDPALDNDVAIARLNPNGSLDKTFSGDGRMAINLCSGGSEESFALARRPSDGRYVLAGWTNCAIGPSDFVMILVSPSP